MCLATTARLLPVAVAALVLGPAAAAALRQFPGVQDRAKHQLQPFTATRRAARSSISSSSFKRTAASTICSTASPAPTPQSTATIPTAIRSRCSRSGSRPVGISSTISGGFLAACNGTGSYPGTDCQMNGFDNESWGCGTTAPTPIRRTVTFLTPRRSHTSTWASTTCWPTRCTPRTSMPAASSRISTSLPVRPARR